MEKICDDEQLYQQIEEIIEDLMKDIQRDFYLDYEPAQDKFIVKTSLTKEKAEFFEKMFLFRRQSFHSNSLDEYSTEDSVWETTNSDSSSDTSESQEEAVESIENSEFLTNHWYGVDAYSSCYNCTEVNDSVKKSSSNKSEDDDSLLERVFSSLRRVESIRKASNSQESFKRKSFVKDYEKPKCLKISEGSNKASQRTLYQKLVNIICPCTMDK